MRIDFEGLPVLQTPQDFVYLILRCYTRVLQPYMGVNATSRSQDNPEQSPNSPRTVLEQLYTDDVAYVMHAIEDMLHSLQRTCYMVLEVTVSQHGPWGHSQV